ncbi:MAG TPA: YggS family pyridoxal phosphate-dependent enzyme [Vicinamibacterales bacterium]|nr:YggS family pyridoxal phosphate-dependent enzyme [Vicinamibacterales bacterium]
MSGPSIADNLAAVRGRLEAAARAAGRSPDSIRLIAVSKTFAPESLREAVAAGQREFGENRVQEALQKMDALADLEIRWHLVGHLQSNKARRAAASFQCIHSIDSLDLLQRVDKAAAEAGTCPEVLVQVDLAGEATKFGVPEEGVKPLFQAELKAVRLVGLMVLPPWTENPDDARPWFARLRQLRDRLEREGIPRERLRELSMGMSHDFEAAILEGSTMVRIGTAIFGARNRGA